MVTCRLYLSRFRRPVYLQRASLVKWGQSKICRTAALWATLVLLSVHESATEKSKVTNRQRADVKLSVKNNTVTVCAFPAASPVPDELRRSVSFPAHLSAGRHLLDAQHHPHRVLCSWVFGRTHGSTFVVVEIPKNISSGGHRHSSLT